MNNLDLKETENQIKIIRTLFFEGMALRNKLFDENSESMYLELEHMKYVVGALFHLIFDVELERHYSSAVQVATPEELTSVNKSLRECIDTVIASIDDIEGMRQYGSFVNRELNEFEYDCCMKLKDIRREYKKLIEEILSDKCSAADYIRLKLQNKIGEISMSWNAYQGNLLEVLTQP